MRSDNLRNVLPYGANPKLLALLRELAASARENKINHSPDYRVIAGPNGTTLQIKAKGSGGTGATIAVWG